MKGNDCVQVTLVRHGLTDYNLHGKVQGILDVPLNSIGLDQAKYASEFLKNETFDAIYSSPLSRAVKTAEAINKHFDLEIQTINDLKEQNFYDFEGADIKELIQNYPNGIDEHIESFESLSERVKVALDKIYEEQGPGKHILLTAHSRTIKAILNHFDNAVCIKTSPIENCSVSRISYDGKDGNVLEMNTLTMTNEKENKNQGMAH